MTEMRLYDVRVTVGRIDGRSVCGLEGWRWRRRRFNSARRARLIHDRRFRVEAALG